MPSLNNNICVATRVSKNPKLTFRPVTFADIPLLGPYLKLLPSRSCDFTTGGIFMWTSLFKYEYAICNDTLFLKSLSEDASHRHAFLVPCGLSPMKKRLDILSAYCRRNGVPMLLTAVPEDILPSVTADLSCKVEELTDWADYIYDAEALATLTGKAYNKKRNHVNRFMADNPEYALEEINEGNIGELKRFFHSLGIESCKADPAMADYEWQRCNDVLDNFDAYKFKGALLRQDDGRIAAFTMGEIKGDTLILHIEKIEHLVAGAGETINKLFAEKMLHSHPEIIYINREDDAGDPGLRKAKESYHPAFLLRKYNVLYD